MRRIVVFGTTGSGKSWLAERLVAEKGLRLVELDALFWGPDWQPAPLDLFRHRVECETRDGDWIAVGIYGQVRDIVWHRADTLVWLDLPLPLVMWRLLGRTLRRIVTQENLWGTGNRESLSRTLFSRDSILLWALKTHNRNRRRFTQDCESFAPGRTVIRLRSSRDVERFIAGRADLAQPLAA
jgi:adenylate kinase family enzyme